MKENDHMKIELENVLPMDIEKRSFEIITEELNGRVFLPEQENIIKRVIHTLHNGYNGHWNEPHPYRHTNLQS